MSDAEQLQEKRWKRRYQSAVDEVSDMVAQEMLCAYEKLTGKKPSDRFREAIEEAVRFDG